MKLKIINHFNILKAFRLFVLLVVSIINSATANAALVSLESQGASPAYQADMTSSVLVSEESKTLDLNFVIRQGTDTSRGVLVSYEEQGFNGTFIVRQQTDTTSGALVSMPAALDMRILNIINNEKIRSVEDYAVWLKKNFKYKKDEDTDNWASPDETLTRLAGDCEDFAFLNEAVLRIFGYKPQVLGLGGGLKLVNHAVCVFKKDSRYLCFDNTTLKITTAVSLEEFGKLVTQNSGYAYVFEIDENKRKVLSDDHQ
ncbi:MAG: transglutaminase-like domain-containing protein [Candidatus Omnitrophota bacterium]